MRLPFEGLVYLGRRPRLWLLVSIPLLINVFVFVVLIGWGFSEFAESLHGWLEGFQGWYWAALLWLAKILFGVIVLVVVYFIFTPVALLIASPFNDRLAENVEKTYGFAIQEQRPFLRTAFAEAGYAIVSEVKKLAVAFGVLLALILLNFLPIVGSLVYAVAAFLWSCWCAGLEFTGYAMDRRHFGLGRKWALLRRYPAPAFGFGTMTVLLLMIPFLNVLVVPVSAVGGTMLFGMIQSRDDT